MVIIPMLQCHLLTDVKAMREADDDRDQLITIKQSETEDYETYPDFTQRLIKLNFSGQEECKEDDTFLPKEAYKLVHVDDTNLDAFFDGFDLNALACGTVSQREQIFNNVELESKLSEDEELSIGELSFDLNLTVTSSDLEHYEATRVINKQTDNIEDETEEDQDEEIDMNEEKDDDHSNVVTKPSKRSVDEILAKYSKQINIKIV